MKYKIKSDGVEVYDRNGFLREKWGWHTAIQMARRGVIKLKSIGVKVNA